MQRSCVSWASRVVVVVISLWLGTELVAAETPRTIVSGRITDVLGRPVRDARIYVLPRVGDRVQTKTNHHGRYSAQVSTTGTHGMVIAIGKAHTFRTVLVQRGLNNVLDVELELDTEGGEVIKIEDKKRPAPAVMPEPLTNSRQAMPYSDEAIERDAWARAWLLLDVDERGRVVRLKLLKRPGFDLDAIAIREAFKLRFEPARDAQGRAMKTYVLWTLEWPAWGWLVQGNGTAVHRPADHHEVHSHGQNIRAGVSGHDMVKGIDRPIGGNWSRPLPNAVTFPHALSRVPCAGSGPLNLDLRNRAYRDCSRADMSIADALPWITPETSDTAIAELAHPEIELAVGDGPPRSRIPEYVGTGITLGLAAAWFVSYRRFDAASQRVQDKQSLLTVEPLEYIELQKDRKKWRDITLGFTAAFVVSTAATVWLWNRDESSRSFSVQPTGDGGVALSMSGTFD